MRILSYLIPVILLASIPACDLEREITIDLPEYEPRLVVECYLEPGQRYSLLLTRSTGYFSPFPKNDAEFVSQILEDSASVTIRYLGRVVRLKNQLVLNPLTRKAFNYSSTEKVPFDLNSEFELQITTRAGETITARTRLLPVVPIDSVVVEFDEGDTLARVLTYFTDLPDQTNYYRRMLHFSSLDSLPEQDFTVDDRFVEKVVAFGTGYNYREGDTIFNTLYHIDRTYYDFLESVSAASNANGNPFAQPSPVLSVFEGSADAIGIFTTLSYDQRRTIIKK